MTRSFSGGIVGAFLGLIIFYGIFLRWEATVYGPWLDQQLAQGLDDGGSSPGLSLLFGIPPAMLLGSIIGAILSNVIYGMWLKKRKPKNS